MRRGPSLERRRGVALTGSGARGVASGDVPGAALEEDRVPPYAVPLRDPLPAPDDAEADPLVECEAGRVLGEDARLDRPQPVGVRARDEGFQERAADASPAAVAGDVDRVLDDPGVTRPSEVGESAAQPTTRPSSTATRRWPGSLPASKSFQDGVSVSNVASPVSMPAA